MMTYSIIMFAVAVVFLVFGIMIYKGNTQLIHVYHQSRIKETDKKAYGKAFSKGIFAIVLTLFLSGLIALLGRSSTVVVVSVAILLIGLIFSFVILIKIQKKFNGGVF